MTVNLNPVQSLNQWGPNQGGSIMGCDNVPSKPRKGRRVCRYGDPTCTRKNPCAQCYNDDHQPDDHRMLRAAEEASAEEEEE